MYIKTLKRSSGSLHNSKSLVCWLLRTLFMGSKCWRRKGSAWANGARGENAQSVAGCTLASLTPFRGNLDLQCRWQSTGSTLNRHTRNIRAGLLTLGFSIAHSANETLGSLFLIKKEPEIRSLLSKKSYQYSSCYSQDEKSS